MKKNLWVISITLVVIAIAVVFFISNTNGENTVTDSGINEKFDKAPSFSLEDFEGNVVSSSDFSGKILVVNSWAVWCPFCVKELSEFVSLQEEFRDEIVIVAIDRQESLSTAKDFTDSLGITNDLIFLLDPRDSFYKSIGGIGMPETLYIDTENNIRLHKRGPMNLDEMRTAVNNILESN